MGGHFEIRRKEAGLQNWNARETESEWFAEEYVAFRRETESLISQNLIVSGPLPVKIP